MSGTTKWTRRQVLGTSAAGVALATGASRPRRAFGQSGRLTYWGGLIFSDDANAMLQETIHAWGEANGIDTEVVMINQNETIQKTSAAVASDTMPDAMDMGRDLQLLLARQDIFHPLDDLYDALGSAQGGWFPAIADATDTTDVAGARTGIPFGASGNLLLRRHDRLEQTGLTEPPATWAELVEHAATVNDPPLFGLGLALSNVGDANVQVSVLHSYGGRIADDSGTNAAIKSEETRTYLEWVKDAWDRGIFPPGNTTWDGAGDNQAYLSGQAAFVANTGSIGIAARNDDPELFEATRYSSLPAGPMGTFSPINPNVRVIPKSSRDPEAARALIEHLSQPEFLSEYYRVAIYGPVLQGQREFAAFDGSDRVLGGLLDLVEKGTPPAFPDVDNAAYADAYSNFVVPKMVQRVVVDGYDLDAAMDEAQQVIQAIYDKY